MSPDEQLWWWVARSSGIVAWALLTANLVWGLVAASRIIRNRGARPWLIDVHRYLGTLSLVFLGVHVFAMWADSYTHFGAADIFVPLASEWRSRAVAWGIVAMYLLAALEISSWLMGRLPKKVWHAIHLSSYALFVTATAHGLLAGADRSNALVQWGLLTGVALVASATWARVSTTRKADRINAGSRVERRRAGTSSTAGVPARSA
jgi:DMSO/TMAO reductase YedYZ heme-binding membrane subunit